MLGNREGLSCLPLPLRGCGSGELRPQRSDPREDRREGGLLDLERGEQWGILWRGHRSSVARTRPGVVPWHPFGGKSAKRPSGGEQILRDNGA